MLRHDETVDGVRFVVPVRSIDARPNPRYFGRRRGVTLLNVDPGADTNRTVYTFVGTPDAVSGTRSPAAIPITCLRRARKA